MNDLVLLSPCDDYTLLDFGDGWRLERFGTQVVERPDVRARGPRACTNWRCGENTPHWVFEPRRGVSGEWRAGPAAQAQCPAPTWPMRLNGQDFELTLGAAGSVGCRPEQQACWQWLQGALHEETTAGENGGKSAAGAVRVLNLFAGPGGASAMALRAGATVSHVAMEVEALARARRNLAGFRDIDWQYTDVSQFVGQAVQRQARYDLILLDPPHFQQTPHGHVWDIQRDLSRLIRTLSTLASPHCRGVWISLHTEDVQAQSVAQLLHEAFPAQRIRVQRIGLAAVDGRVLPAVVAVYWLAESAAEAQRPLDAAQLEDRMEVLLDAVLSSRRTASEPAQRLSALARPAQEFILRWVDSIAQTNAEMAFQLALHAGEALTLLNVDPATALGRNEVQGWILHAMDAFDRTGVHAGASILHDVKAYAQAQCVRRVGVAFEDVAVMLGLFVQGLSGRALKLEKTSSPRTDTETLYLPALLTALPTRADNLRLYKAICVWLWAQTRFGSYRAAKGIPRIATVLSAYADPDRAARCFLALEAIRLDACLARHLPGAQRAAALLRAQTDWSLVPPGWEATAARLQRPEARVTDTHALLAVHYATGVDPVLPPWAGGVDAAGVEGVLNARLVRDKAAFQTWLVTLVPGVLATVPPGREAPPGLHVLHQPDEAQPEGFSLRLELDGQPIAAPAEVNAAMGSIMLDLGDIPDEYLVASGGGGYRMQEGDAGELAGVATDDVWKGTYHEEGAYLYNEWDFKRGDYRKNWCVLREVEVSPQSQDFVQHTLRRYRNLIKALRRSFEVLRGEDRQLKKQPTGDDVDIDALVEAHAEMRAGREMSDRLFLKKHRHERNMAVMFMVDMSGSTKGWINDAERESLVLLCEALEVLGDRYAIYGFSGNTRKKCELFRIKRFDETYDDTVRARIAGISPQEYTRMGVSIRHLTRLLVEIEARTKLLITLSDGKPDDFDGYRGEYGIEDTRQALIEAQQQGIHPFCITIDEEARDYLPHMYGAVNYAVIDDVAKLPLKVADIYRRLTT